MTNCFFLNLFRKEEFKLETLFPLMHSSLRFLDFAAVISWSSLLKEIWRSEVCAISSKIDCVGSDREPHKSYLFNARPLVCWGGRPFLLCALLYLSHGGGLTLQSRLPAAESSYRGNYPLSFDLLFLFLLHQQSSAQTFLKDCALFHSHFPVLFLFCLDDCG